MGVVLKRGKKNVTCLESCPLLSFSGKTYTPFTLHCDNRSEPVWTGLVASVITHRTVPSGTVLRRMVPPKRGGPDQSRTFPLASINATVPYRSVPLKYTSYSSFIVILYRLSTINRDL